jgi:hypothetical protein
VFKRIAYPSSLLLVLTLAACGGGGGSAAPEGEIATQATSTAAAEYSSNGKGKKADSTVLMPTPAPAPAPTAAYHLYVATTGSDSNPGTQSAPFKTILRASQAAKPDTIVHVAPGTYPGGFQTR